MKNAKVAKHAKKFFLAVFAAFAFLAFSVSPLAQRRGGPPPPPARPTPHWPDGRVNLGPPAGETGFWTPPGIVQLSVFDQSVNRVSPTSHAIVDAFVMNFKTGVVFDYAPGSSKPESSGKVKVLKKGKAKIK